MCRDTRLVRCFHREPLRLPSFDRFLERTRLQQQQQHEERGAVLVPLSPSSRSQWWRHAARRELLRGATSDVGRCVREDHDLRLLNPHTPPLRTLRPRPTCHLEPEHDVSPVSQGHVASPQDDRSPPNNAQRCHPKRTSVKPKKYLKDHQRCEIVLRVRAGERQAHLAREFGITRAAVCYLLRHDSEILAKFAASMREHAATDVQKLQGMCL